MKLLNYSKLANKHTFNYCKLKHPTNVFRVHSIDQPTYVHQAQKHPRNKLHRLHLIGQ
jgi:hypothetical protein